LPSLATPPMREFIKSCFVVISKRGTARTTMGFVRDSHYQLFSLHVHTSLLLSVSVSLSLFLGK
jgi:hypothetical protein